MFQANLCDTSRFRASFGFEIKNFRNYRYCFEIGIEKTHTLGIGIVPILYERLMRIGIVSNTKRVL